MGAAVICHMWAWEMNIRNKPADNLLIASLSHLFSEKYYLKADGARLLVYEPLDSRFLKYPHQFISSKTVRF